MKSDSIFKTVFLLLNLVGVSAVGYLQWRNLELKKKYVSASSQIVSDFTKKWDKQTGRTFAKIEDLDLNINAVPLEVIIANLSQNNTTRYLTAYPVIKFSKGTLKKTELEKALPLIRETFFEVINKKSAEDIMGKNGILNLKEDLLRELNYLNLPLEIEKIYFLSIVVS